jgi:hypothetical protein
VDQVKAPHDQSNLSSLQTPDKMPTDWVSPQCFDFWKRLLESAFTEDRQTSGNPLADPVEAHRFCCGNEANAPIRPSRSLSREPDPLEDEPKILTDWATRL